MRILKKVALSLIAVSFCFSFSAFACNCGKYNNNSYSQSRASSSEQDSNLFEEFNQNTNLTNRDADNGFLGQFESDGVQY